MSFYEEVAKRVLERTEWLPCPSCQNEYSGLFTIRFVDDQKHRREVEICGECKSFVPGLEYARTFLPLKGSIVTKRQMGTLADRMYLAAIIDRGPHSVTVLPYAAGGFTFKLANDPENVTHRGADCFDTWIKIRRLLTSPEVQSLPAVQEKKGFGGLKTFNFNG